MVTLLSKILFLRTFLERKQQSMTTSKGQAFYVKQTHQVFVSFFFFLFSILLLLLLLLFCFVFFNGRFEEHYENSKRKALFFIK